MVMGGTGFCELRLGETPSVLGIGDHSEHQTSSTMERIHTGEGFCAFSRCQDLRWWWEGVRRREKCGGSRPVVVDCSREVPFKAHEPLDPSGNEVSSLVDQ